MLCYTVWGFYGWTLWVKIKSRKCEILAQKIGLGWHVDGLIVRIALFYVIILGYFPQGKFHTSVFSLYL